MYPEPSLHIGSTCMCTVKIGGPWCDGLQIKGGADAMQDAVAVWEAVLGEEKPPTVLVGHSMGGAIATWAACLQVRYPVHPCP